MRYSSGAPERRIETPVRFAFYLTNGTDSPILQMKKYSVAEAAKLAGVSRTSAYRWIQHKVVPPPLTEVIAGVTVTYWTDKEVADLQAYKASRYWGKGKRKDRRGKVKRQKM
jgi:predicted DNA-binding transcriptional regulator AlpA